jgi:hypothetical protein
VRDEPRSCDWDSRAWSSLQHNVPVERQVGLSCRERRDTLQAVEASKGRIPRALWVFSTHWGSKGVNRQEGSQTLKAELRQPGILPDQWTFEPDMC